MIFKYVSSATKIVLIRESGRCTYNNDQYSPAIQGDAASITLNIV